MKKQTDEDEEEDNFVDDNATDASASKSHEDDTFVDDSATEASASKSQSSQPLLPGIGDDFEIENYTAKAQKDKLVKFATETLGYHQLYTFITTLILSFLENDLAKLDVISKHLKSLPVSIERTARIAG